MLLLTRRMDAGIDASLSATLDFHTRLKSRARITLSDGREAGLMLARGRLLRGGDVLGSEDGSEQVRIIAAAEEVSVVTTDDPLLLAITCYHLGNRHVPLQIEAASIAYQHDHVLDEMVRGLGLEVRHAHAPFEPVSGAYDSDGHSHSHFHSNSHSHSHSH